MCSTDILSLLLSASEEAMMDARMPFLYLPGSLPCLLHCENDDRGGERVAFHIQDDDQKSSLYRTDRVPIELCDDVGVGYDVSKRKEDEWLKYTVQVSRAAEYIFRIRLQGAGDVSISVNSQNRTGLIFAACDSWGTVSSAPVALSPGEQAIWLHVHRGCFRMNYIDISKARSRYPFHTSAGRQSQLSDCPENGRRGGSL